MKRNVDALWKECVGEVQGVFAPNDRPNRIPYTDTPANTMGISSMSAVKDLLDPGAACTIGYDGFLFARRLFVHQCFPNTEETAELLALQKPNFVLQMTASSSVWYENTFVQHTMSPEILRAVYAPLQR